LEQYNLNYTLFYITISSIVLFLCLALDFRTIKLNKRIINYLTNTILFLLILIVGLRDYDVGTDTIEYYPYKWQMNLASNSSELLMDIILKLVKYFNGSFTIFLLVYSTIYFVFFYKSFVNYSKVYKVYPIILFFIFISLFFSESMGINVIRQGVSLAFLAYAYSLWITKFKIIKIIPFIILSFLSHTTSVIPILTFIIINYVFKKQELKYFYVLYVLGIILSVLNIGILNIVPFLQDFLQDSRRSIYLTSESEKYIVGFKPQFVAFNTIFLLIFIYVNKLLKNKNLNFNYEILLKYYISISFIFFMAFQIPYSDRWGLFSWVSIPFLVAPAFSEYIKPHFKTSIVLFFVLIFTFFKFYDK